MKIAGLVVVLSLSVAVAAAEEPVVGGPCVGCELVYAGIPERLDSRASVVPEGVDGEPLRIVGTVSNAAGVPVEGIIVYAYQTDANGIYPPGETRHGALRAWVRTDERGLYQFDTIRPGSYPQSRIPQHVHLHVIEPGRATYYIDDIVFSDDPFLIEEHDQNARGGSGLCEPTKDKTGAWLVRRDIFLGRNIPGYDDVGVPSRP